MDGVIDCYTFRNQTTCYAAGCHWIGDNGCEPTSALFTIAFALIVPIIFAIGLIVFAIHTFYHSRGYPILKELCLSMSPCRGCHRRGYTEIEVTNL